MLKFFFQVSCFLFLADPETTTSFSQIHVIKDFLGPLTASQIQSFQYMYSSLRCAVKFFFGHLHYKLSMYYLIVMFIVHVTVNGAKAKHFLQL